MTRTEHDLRLAVDPGADPDAVARLQTFAVSLDVAGESKRSDWSAAGDKTCRADHQVVTLLPKRPAGRFSDGARTAAVMSAAAVVVAAVAAGVMVTHAGSDGRQNVAGNGSTVAERQVPQPLKTARLTSYGAGVGPQNLPACASPSYPPAQGGALGADTFGNFRILDEGTVGNTHYTVGYQLGRTFVHFEICETNVSTLGRNDGYVDRNTGVKRPWRPGVDGGLTVGPNSFAAFGGLGYLAVAVPADAVRVIVLDEHGKPAASLNVFDELISSSLRVAAGTQPVSEPSAIVSYDANGREIYRQDFGPYRTLSPQR